MEDSVIKTTIIHSVDQSRKIDEVSFANEPPVQPTYYIIFHYLNFIELAQSCVSLLQFNLFVIKFRFSLNELLLQIEIQFSFIQRPHHLQLITIQFHNNIVIYKKIKLENY